MLFLLNLSSYGKISEITSLFPKIFSFLDTMLFVSSTSHTDASFLYHWFCSWQSSFITLHKFWWETSVVHNHYYQWYTETPWPVSLVFVSHNLITWAWFETTHISIATSIISISKANIIPLLSILTTPHLDFDFNLPPLTWTLLIVLHWAFLLLDSFHSISYTVINLTWSELSPV